MTTMMETTAAPTTTMCYCGSKDVCHFYLSVRVNGNKLRARCREHTIYTKKDSYPMEITRDEFIVYWVMGQ